MSEDNFDIEKIEQDAKNGLATAQAYLGGMYYWGDQVETDFEKAFYWFKRAQEQGSVRAPNCLGLMHLEGNGVAQDIDLAISYYELPAEHNYQRSIEKLFEIYLLPDHGKQDFNKAFYWGEKAVAFRDAELQFNFAIMHGKGLGCPQNKELYAHWTRKSDEQGYGKAQYNLCIAYFDGWGVEKDLEKASHWHALADKQGCIKRPDIYSNPVSELQN